MHDGFDSRFCSPTPTVPADLPEGVPARRRFLNIPPLVVDLDDLEARKDPHIRAILERRGL